MIKVKENPSFARTDAGGIVNTDDGAYAAFVESRKSAKELSDRVGQLEEKLDAILNILEKIHATN